LPADVYDVDMDCIRNPNCTTEPTPDLLGTDRVLDDPLTRNTGIPPTAGDCRVVDMGAYEYAVDLCPAARIVSIEPPTDDQHWLGDARQPHPVQNNAWEARQGLGSAEEPIRITMSISVSEACFLLCETGPEETDQGLIFGNGIASVTLLYVAENNESLYDIVLLRPISSGELTTIIYIGGAGDQCQSSVTFGSLPGDVNDDHIATVTDVARLIDYLNSAWQPPITAEALYRTDLNHSGATNPQDLITAVDLLNGAMDFLAWRNRSLPPENCAEHAVPGGGGTSSGGGRPSASGPDLADRAPRPKGSDVQPVGLPPDP
jgi:hypothetical protein